MDKETEDKLNEIYEEGEKERKAKLFELALIYGNRFDRAKAMWYNVSVYNPCGSWQMLKWCITDWKFLYRQLQYRYYCLSSVYRVLVYNQVTRL